MKVAIFGLGGVGGYFAAQASHYFKGREDIEFYYIARGEHLKAIKRDGLRLKRDQGEDIIAHPKMATDNPSDCGVVDYLVYATKSYSIDENIESIRAITDKNSVIVTFMNGVDGAEKLRAALPDVTIVEGCVFIYSYILSSGVIVESGDFAQYQIGGESQGAKEFFSLFEPAIDRLTFNEDVMKKIWGKFSYISPFATVATQYNITSGEIVGTPKYNNIYHALCDEFEAVVKALGVELGFNVYEENIAIVARLPEDSTCSMQRDYHSGKMCEYESLSGYISRKGSELGIPTPQYDKAARYFLS
ncbi:MAG: 2-dehydropantoate 2-reductase [Rikenellaceae bacterium]